MRPVIVAGWLTGLLLLLAGWPWPAALAVPVVITVAAATYRWWSAWLRGRWLGLRVKMKTAIRRQPKTGSAVERV